MLYSISVYFSGFSIVFCTYNFKLQNVNNYVKCITLQFILNTVFTQNPINYGISYLNEKLSS